MSNPDLDRLAAAVKALYRIRAVERPPGPDGFREVWHHCPQGADLVSLVDAEGRLVRQELTLLEDLLRWTPGDGVTTGASRAAGTGGQPSVALVSLDAEPSAPRLARARRALSGFSGADPYLRHVKQAIDLAGQGRPIADAPVVTGSVDASRFRAKLAAESDRRSKLWWGLAGAAALVALGAAAVGLIAR